jgi:hypothetical protein
VTPGLVLLAAALAAGLPAAPEDAAEGRAAEAPPAVPADAATVGRVVLFDDVEVFLAIGADSAAAEGEAERVRGVLRDAASARRRGSTLRLAERDGAGLLLVDSVEVLSLHAENRVDPASSPLANALALEEALRRAQERDAATTWSEDELLLRLLLGIVFPISLLAVLRLTRLAVTRWERSWRRTARRWLDREAERRGVEAGRGPGRAVVRVVAGVVRFGAFGGTVVAMSLVWFALFPQTRELAGALLAALVEPFLALLGGTARGGLHLVYSAAVFLLAARASAWIGRRQAEGAGLLGDPLLAFPLRLCAWVLAVFLVLLPYPGAPRVLGVGLLLLALLGALVAARPLIEEIAAGLYVHAHYDLREGRVLRIDDVPGAVVGARLTHLEVARDDGRHSIPYSRILRADVTYGGGTTGS